MKGIPHNEKRDVGILVSVALSYAELSPFHYFILSNKKASAVLFPSRYDEVLNEPGPTTE